MDAADAVEAELQRRLRKLLEVTPAAVAPRPAFHPWQLHWLIPGMPGVGGLRGGAWGETVDPACKVIVQRTHEPGSRAAVSAGDGRVRHGALRGEVLLAVEIYQMDPRRLIHRYEAGNHITTQSRATRTIEVERREPDDAAGLDGLDKVTQIVTVVLEAG